MMIAAVRRARRPGCKFDQILVLESPEGWDKSTAWAVLAGEGNFSDASIIGKDARAVQEELADIWIHENAELSGLGKADIEHVKHFASRVNDRARAAYGRVLTDQPRQSIEVGTTNAEVYLMSPTGNRRFWGFKLLRPVDTARLRADRLTAMGRSGTAETGGETLVLDEALWDEAGHRARETTDNRPVGRRTGEFGRCKKWVKLGVFRPFPAWQFTTISEGIEGSRSTVGPGGKSLRL